MIMSITASGSGPVTRADIDPQSDGVVTYNSENDPGDPYGRYEPDDPEVLSKLFRIRS